MAGWIKMPLGMKEGLRPGDFVLDGDLAPLSQHVGSQFSAHIYFAQTARWIKMALGMEVGFGPGHIVLDGTKKGADAPNFWPISIVAKRLVDQHVTCYRGRPRPRPHCVRWGTSLNQVPKKGAQPSIFRPWLLWPLLYANLVRR